MLKKWFFIILLVLLTLIPLLFLVKSFYKEDGTQISVLFNDVSVTMGGKNIDLVSLNYNGTTYVPIQSISVYFDSWYQTDEKKNIINILPNHKSVNVSIPSSFSKKKGQSKIYANLNKYSFQYEGVVTYLNSIYYKGINFVPLRYYAELFFKKINLNSNGNKIEITTPPSDFIAVVNGEGVEKRDFDSFNNSSIRKIDKQSSGQDTGDIEEQKKKTEEDNYNYFVSRQVLKQKASENGVVLDQSDYDALNKYLDNYVGGASGIDDFRAELAKNGDTFQQVALYNRDNFLIQKLYNTMTQNLSATEEQIKKYYDDNKATLIRPESVTLKQILFSTVDADNDAKLENVRKNAQDILDRIKAGENFDTLMKKYSQDPGLKDNPNGYTLSKGEMIKGFQEAALALQVGQISDVVRSPYGFHIIELLGKAPEKQMTYEEARDNIKSTLEKEMKDKYYDGLVSKWMTESKIEKKINTY